MWEKLRFAVSIAMIWLAAVAGVSVTAWFAIDRAGRDISNAGVSSLRPTPIGTPDATPTPDNRTPDNKRPDNKTPDNKTPDNKRPDNKTPDNKTPDNKTPANSRSRAAPTPAPSATRIPSVATARTPKPRAPSPPRGSLTRLGFSTTTRDRTFHTAGGQVSVRCIGATMLLRIAQPGNGWRVEVREPGPERVEVRFLRVNNNTGSGTRVMAVCEKGTPVFRENNQG